MFRFFRRLPIAVAFGINRFFGKQCLFDLIFELSAKVAIADGAIDASEIATIELFVIDTLGFSPEQRRRALEVVRTTRRSSRLATTIAREISNTVWRRGIVLEAVLDLLMGIAFADGDYSAEEEVLIESVAKCFGLGAETLRRLEASYATQKRPGSSHQRKNQTSAPQPNFFKEEPNCYAILGCKSTDTLGTIKKHYRRLAKALHPDTAVRQGAPVELVKRSEVRFRQLQEAYEEIMRLRNGKAK